MTLDNLVFLIIMTYFVTSGQYELADHMKKHKIVNKIESRLTRVSRLDTIKSRDASELYTILK